MEGLMSTLSGLFGPKSPLMDILGSEGMKNLITGGTSIMNTMGANDQLDFTKNAFNTVDARNAEKHDLEMDMAGNRMSAFDDVQKNPIGNIG